jgi:hypothetical protein
LRVTFSHAVRTSSVPLQLPMRSTFWMSPDTARISRTRWSASRLRAALTPVPPHPAANASTQPLTIKPSRAVTSLTESDAPAVARERAQDEYPTRDLDVLAHPPLPQLLHRLAGQVEPPVIRVLRLDPTSPRPAAARPFLSNSAFEACSQTARKRASPSSNVSSRPPARFDRLPGNERSSPACDIDSANPVTSLLMPPRTRDTSTQRAIH